MATSDDATGSDGATGSGGAAAASMVLPADAIARAAAEVNDEFWSKSEVTSD